MARTFKQKRSRCTEEEGSSTKTVVHSDGEEEGASVNKSPCVVKASTAAPCSLKDKIESLDVVWVIFSETYFNPRIQGGSFNNGPQGIVAIERSACPTNLQRAYDSGCIIAESKAEVQGILDLIVAGKAFKLPFDSVMHAHVSNQAAGEFGFVNESDDEDDSDEEVPEHDKVRYSPTSVGRCPTEPQYDPLDSRPTSPTSPACEPSSSATQN